MDNCEEKMKHYIYIYIYIYCVSFFLHNCPLLIPLEFKKYIYIYIYSIGTRKAGDLGSTPSECQIFYLFRCVLSSVQPLRSVGRSNFDKGRHNLTTLIYKTDIY